MVALNETTPPKGADPAGSQASGLPQHAAGAQRLAPGITNRNTEGCAVTTYDAEFYELEGKVARESAAVVVPWLLERHPEIQSVVDIGCGTGEWVAAFAERGCDAGGCDFGVPLELLVIDHYHDGDITRRPGIVGADLAVCLEVAEHLPFDFAGQLVKGLARDTRYVLFSAATPGQPGVGHINCQPHEFWHALFAEHGKTPEFIGEQFDEPVADFYRRNMYLYR